MEEHTLKGEYISVLKDGRLSYGGSQRWSDSPNPAGVWVRGHRGPGPAAVSGAAAGVGSAQSTLAGGPVPWTCMTGGPDS